MSGENKAPAEASADTTNESDVQAFGTPITVGGDGGKSEATASGTPITVGGEGSPQEQ